VAVEEPFRVAAIGDNCLDVYMAIDQFAVGGNALNVAVQWGRRGLDSEYLGIVGTDRGGTLVRNALTTMAVSSTRLRAVDGDTGVTHLRSTEDGDRVIGFEAYGVSATYTPTAADVAHLATCAWVHGATLPDFRDAVARLSQASIRVSYDFSTKHETQGLAGLEIAFYSWDGPREDGAVALARAALDGGARLAVVTCGAFGSLCVDGHSVRLAEARRIAPIDTCGAGDAFIAAFVDTYLRGNELDICMRAGTDMATETCMHLGGWPQLLQPLVALAS
jgi:fructoselysine 6-kinase